MIPNWLTLLPLNLIRVYASKHRLDWELVAAICMVESAGNAKAMRYEPDYQWLYETQRFAGLLNITEATERMLQKCSCGLMQTMGALLRELGYKGYLPVIDDSESLDYGCMHLRRLFDRGYSEEQVISAYNAGSPRKINGMYSNQRYVDKVYQYLKELRGGA